LSEHSNYAQELPLYFLRPYFSASRILSSPGSDVMYAFHPGHQFACHLQSRPKKDLGALSYFARNPQFSQL